MAVSALAKSLAAEGRDIINLGAGEPDFPTPARVAEAGIRAIRDGFTRYTPAAGLPELRKAIAADLSRSTGAECSPECVVVTAGAKQALFNSCFALFGPGDRVLIPSPYWTSYPDMVRLARAEPVEVPGDERRGFKVGRPELERAFAGGGARGLILNSPSNPTGAVYTSDELREVLDWAAEREVWLISDEIYGRICYVDERAAGVLHLEHRLPPRTVVVDGASKVFAMTGWRIGFSYSDPQLASKMAAVQSHITSNASTPSQYAALEAFSPASAASDEVDAMLAAFRARRELVIGLVEERLPGAEYVRPDGAFYLFLRTDRWYGPERPDSTGFCRWLLENAGVALVPGSAFGDDRYVRLSFAASEDDLARAIDRVARALEARAD